MKTSFDAIAELLTKALDTADGDLVLDLQINLGHYEEQYPGTFASLQRLPAMRKLINAIAEAEPRGS